MSDKQKTIKAAVTVSGVGLHTGAEVNLTFKPAPENHGYKFRRTDLPGKPVVEATLENVLYHRFRATQKVFFNAF